MQPTHSIDILSGCEQFARVDEYTIRFNDLVVHGAIIETDVKTNCGYFSDISLRSMLSTIPNWRIAAIGRFVSRINDTIVFTKSNIEDALATIVELGEDFNITLCSDSFDVLPVGEENRAGTLTRMDLDQLRHVSALHQEVTASLKQGKIESRSIPAADEPVMDISDLMDSKGNL